ncbi:MAG: ABC transporter permease [Bryobacteraceae bacterium]|nr:ABC transporter permease [Bryobacteraceae bacterium]
MNAQGRLALLALAAIYGIALLAPWIVPHDPAAQYRDSAWSPPGTPGFPLGADGLGRDQLSRLLAGARVSLLSGTLAAAVAVAVGGTLGSLAVLARGGFSAVILRAADLSMAVPWTYALLALRAALPLQLPPERVFWAVMAMLGLVGWARAARLAYGVAAGVRDRDYVLASRGFGARSGYILRHHLLPEALPALGVHFVLAAPQYVLAETTLTFLGLGFPDSYPSWGSLLAAAARLDTLLGHGWMLLPAPVFAGVFLCYHTVGVSLAQRWQPGPAFQAIR